MKGWLSRFTCLLANWRVDAHFHPTIWRTELAYSTGTGCFGSSIEGRTHYAR